MGIHLLTGDDESLVRTKAHDLISHLVGDGERSLMVDEFDGDDYELRWVVDAAQTMPFLTDQRIVVARDIGRFSADELTPLIGYLLDPLESTHLVLVGGGGRLAKKLIDTIGGAGGHVTDTNPPRKAGDRATWVRAEAEQDGVRLDAAAAARIAEQLGDDMGRLEGIVAVLRSTFGEGVRVTAVDVEPFLGQAGDVPPWDFTDAIDTGNTSKALTMLSRMVNGGERHPLQVMAILHSHYVKLARLDGVDARSENDAAAAMGIKPGFPAKKALGNYRRLGGTGVHRAIDLLARADMDLRGETDLDSETVMEVLVARLSKLGPPARRS
jgi:DNA polymerase-3 subunit delta